MARRKRHLRPRSLEAYKYHFRTLTSFFDPNRTLSSFHEGDLRDYQRWRNLPDTDHGKAGPSLINHELGALAQVLKLAGLWIPISNYYERLPTINVAETAKNRHRVRAVPLNETALAAVRDLLALARERGSIEPRHHLIAFRVKKGMYAPDRPASPYFIRTAFRAIGSACGLRWVTPTSFRHQAITKLLESGAPDETVRAIAGHVSQRAMSYYSHIRIEAKKVALDRLQPLPKGANPACSRKGAAFPLLGQLRTMANQLGIAADAALELVLTYERSKTQPSELNQAAG